MSRHKRKYTSNDENQFKKIKKHDEENIKEIITENRIKKAKKYSEVIVNEGINEDVCNKLFFLLYLIYRKKLIINMDCQTPKFKNQMIIENNGLYKLDDLNSIIVKNQFLDNENLSQFIKNIANTKRISSYSGFGIKPRYEVCYTVTGEPYVYSNFSHYTIKFPSYILDIVPNILSIIEEFGLDNKYKNISHGVNILYSSDFERGGSISAHKDNEMEWGLVIILSYGQSRWLRVRSCSTGKYYNVKMKHNSLICMYGSTFQKKYTHQVDKLNKKEKVGNRISINIRFSE